MVGQPSGAEWSGVKWSGDCRSPIDGSMSGSPSAVTAYGPRDSDVVAWNADAADLGPDAGAVWGV